MTSIKTVTSNDNLKIFKVLLTKFQHNQDRKDATPPTYLEIAGKAHKEDVISNILAFFFDSEQPHGLGGIFLNSFLSCMREIQSDVNGQIFAYREITTANGKRIDIVIESEYSVLIIENKINHWLHNDLREYAAHAQRHYKNKKAMLAVLSIDPQTCKPPFVNVTYNNLIAEINQQLTKRNIKAEGKFEILLNDFFQTLKNLRSTTMINEQMRAFFIENEKALKQLDSEKRNLDNEVQRRAYELSEKISKRPDVENLVWSRHVVVNQKHYPNGLLLKADCVVNIEGYQFHTFLQRDGKDDSTSELLNAIPYFKDNSDWDAWPISLSFDTPMETVIEKMNEFIKTVFQ